MKSIENKIERPPEALGLTALFNHAFDRGLGRPLRHGMAEPWTVFSLEMAFDSVGRSVSVKSIENWRSGASLPSRQNIHVLSRLFAGDDNALQRQWLDALLMARERSRQQVQAPKPKAPEPDTPEPDTPAPAPTLKPAAQRRTPRRRVLALAAVSALACFGLGAAAMAAKTRSAEPLPTLTDIRFCAESDFDKVTKRCRVARDRLAPDAGPIHVSFESHNITSGQAFERRWYREGEVFLTRDGYFDEVWENWTWLKQGDAHPVGTYHLRIIIDGRVTTAGFTVETSE